MSIRWQQLLLLLGIALLPVFIAGLQSQRQIDDMATTIAANTRAQELQRDRHYLREKVADLGTGLRLVGASTEHLLLQQKQIIEAALAAPSSGPDIPVLYSENLQQVEAGRPSFWLADADCDAGNCAAAVQAIAHSEERLRALHEDANQLTLWHFAGLDNGVSMVFPGHGGYPQDFDARNRAWYLQAMQQQALSWLPSTIDASTGQPVLTAVIALRDPSGRAIGATGIDLPLRQLLNFHSSAAPWLNVARLALLELDQAGVLKVIAMQEPLAANADWRSGQQTLALSGIPGGSIQEIQALQRGESMLFDNFVLADAAYSIAITAMSDSGNTWLALMSPHSASEAAVQKALAFVEVARADSIQRHLIGGLGLAALVVVLALLAANRVTRPLIHMSRTAEDLADGKLSSRTGLMRRDELGTLSASIDRMADSIEQLQLEQEKAYRDMIMSLHRALEKKDAYTAGHSGRVTKTALRLGRRLGLDDKTLEILRFGALTHDLGKIGIDDAILNKPAPLDAAEKEIMKQHPAFSKTIMKPLVRFEEYAEIAGSHHEHWDGSGYPDGLQGEDIHLLARLVGIADAWDSMTGDRVYRKGMPLARALDILESEQDDGQFDPRLIREFLAMVREDLSATTKPDE